MSHEIEASSMVLSTPVVSRAAGPPHANDAIAPRSPDSARIPSRGAANPMLFSAIVTLGFGLAAVTASLIPWSDETSALLPPQGRSVTVQSLPALESPRLAAHDGVSTRPMAGERPHRPYAAVIPPVSTGVPWAATSSLHTEATLWEILRVSAPRDQRVFLLRTAIQLHTPAAVPAGTPQRVLPSKEG